MDWQSAIADMERRCSLGEEHAPRGIFTIIAIFLVKGLILVLTVVVIPVGFVTTTVGGVLLILTFNLLSLVFTAFWLPVFGLLMGTSWLWLKAWPLRPLLLLPGVALAVIGETYVALAPDPERDAKHAKLSIA